MIRLLCMLLGHQYITAPWELHRFCISCGKEKR